jgi:hypothetical protein
MAKGQGIPLWPSFWRCCARGSHDIFEKLYHRSNPCLAMPCKPSWRRSPCRSPLISWGRWDPSSCLYSANTPAVAFVFFPQVGLRVASHRSKAAVDRPSVP